MTETAPPRLPTGRVLERSGYRRRARFWPRLAPVAILAQALVFVPLAFRRFLDGDEGVYAYAAHLAGHGARPYRDFFYEQLPLLPYAYGGWSRIFGESWISLRLLSALIGAGVGALLYRQAQRRFGPDVAVAAVCLYALSGLVFGYFSTLKTFGLGTLFLLAGAVAADEGEEERVLPWALAGLLAGLAVDTRLVFAAGAALLGLYAWRRGRLSAFAGALAVGLLPTLWFLVRYPHAFWFDTVRYHSLKSAGGLVGDFGQKARTAANLVGFGQTDHAVSVQFLLLVLAAAAAVVLRRRLSFAALMVVALGVASLLPTPAYTQYFCVVVPFLILAALDVVGTVRPPAGWFGLAGVTLYALAAPFAFAHDVETSPLLKPSIRSVEKVADAVDRRAHPGERVLSGWPGYLLDTHARAWPGYSNHFAPIAAAHVSPAEARRLHLASELELEAAIRARKPRLVVSRNWVTSPPFAQWGPALQAARYRLVETVETARIYER